MCTCARSCLRRGDADASTTRSRRNVFNVGMLRGGGGPGGALRTAGVPEADLSFPLGTLGLSVYGGGGSDGRRLFDMAVIGRDASATRNVFSRMCKSFWYRLRRL